VGAGIQWLPVIIQLTAALLDMPARSRAVATMPARAPKFTSLGLRQSGKVA
jgi:hypothetical protein